MRVVSSRKVTVVVLFITLIADANAKNYALRAQSAHCAHLLFRTICKVKLRARELCMISQNLFDWQTIYAERASRSSIAPPANNTRVADNN